MKTLGRVLVILIAFAVMMGITYSAVSAGGSSSANAPAFQNGEGFTPDTGPREFRDASLGGIGMMLGLLKNIVIVAVITALAAFPKNLLQQQRRAAPVRIK